MFCKDIILYTCCTRNVCFIYPNRKQYSPLSPSSPDESESPPERINIDLMHELRDVIFPNTPPVDRTVSNLLNIICFI